jgi:hypothetical protein
MAFDHVPVLYQIHQESIPLERYAKEVKEAVSEKINVSHEIVREQVATEDALIPELPCEYCGNWHIEGQCPYLLEDDFFLR